MGGPQVAEADEKGGWDVLFLGDSLFEPWRGTKMDQAWSAYEDIPATWSDTFGKAFGEKAHILAISGASYLCLLSRRLSLATSAFFAVVSCLQLGHLLQDFSQLFALLPLLPCSRNCGS